MAAHKRKLPRQVFLNVPFDLNYKPIFDAVVFTVIACGYEPRCALESSDSGTPRVNRLRDLIRDCRLSIHDLSRIELDADSGLPRFNMPFEFGLFIGARDFGGAGQRRKVCLVLAGDRFSYQKYISDIAGQDVAKHNNDPSQAIEKARDFFRGHRNPSSIPGASVIISSYQKFMADLPRLSALPKFRYDADKLAFKDYCALARAFLVEEGIWRLS